MAILQIPYTVWKQKFKPRFIFLSLFAIFIIFIIPGIFNFSSDWVPTGAVYDKSEFGYSNSFSMINKEYQIIPMRHDFTDFDLTSLNKLLIILTPEDDLSDAEIDYLKTRINTGLPILIVGSKGMDLPKLENMESLYFQIGDFRIFDSTNNGNDIGLPEVTNDLESEFVSVVPYEITDIRGKFGNVADDSLLMTKSTSTNENCIRHDLSDPNCFGRRSISAKFNNFIILTDAWMLRNYYTNQFPQNLEVLPYLFDSFNIPITEIYIDETHLDWIPVNRAGLRIASSNLIGSNGLLVAFLTFGVIFPILLSLNNQLISFTPAGTLGSTLSNKIFKRLDDIHTSRVPAIPLSLEERILTLENLDTRTLGSKYLQKVANELILYIKELGIENQFPNVNWNNLTVLSKKALLEVDSWQIITDTNKIIELIQSNELFQLDPNKDSYSNNSLNYE